MADDVGRLDERLEQFVKLVDQRFTYHEEQDDTRFADLREEITSTFKAFETLMRDMLTKTVAVHDAKADVLQAKLEAQQAKLDAQKIVAEARTDLVDARNVPYRSVLKIIGATMITTLAGAFALWLWATILAHAPLK